MSPKFAVVLLGLAATLAGHHCFLLLPDCLHVSRAELLPKLSIILYAPDGDAQPDTHFAVNNQLGWRLTNHSAYRSERPTVLYLHGYIEMQASESVRTVVAAYRQRDDHNILVLDWGQLADGNYVCNAVRNCRAIGAIVGDALVAAFGQGLPVERFHVVGHSLGGQMAGFAGRRVRAESKGALVLSRISALDPANPPFYLDGTHLRSTDAQFVDIIHTDAWLYGAPKSSGTVDFWPNSGYSLQPGCDFRNILNPLSENDLCSHHRSWRFWADSLIKSRSFPAVHAASWRAFCAGQFSRVAEVAFMGIDANRSSSGDMYLQTNGGRPFGRSYDGLLFA